MAVTLHHAPDWLGGIIRDIDSARHSVFIAAMTAHAPPPRNRSLLLDFYASLLAAKKRGVRIYVRLALLARSQNASIGNAQARAFLAAHGIDCALLAPGGILHAKCYVIDRQIAWVGSGNLTEQSALRNAELMARIECPIVAQDAIDFLEGL